MWAIVQKWEESEAGWGTRPDGYTLHKTEEDIQSFLKKMRDREAEHLKPGEVPEEYTRPSGKPYWTRIDDPKEAERLKNSECGIWGQDRNNYPTPVAKGADQTGWVTMTEDRAAGRIRR